MTPHAVQVTIDNRARLLSAALAVTTWPDDEQVRKRHRAHVHARNTARRIQPDARHPAVVTLQTLLDQGVSLPALYSFALALSWPDLRLNASVPRIPVTWAGQLGDFLNVTALDYWWADEDDVWQRAADQTRKVLAEVNFHAFLQPFVGALSEQLNVMPNISYPSDTDIAVRSSGQIFCLIPPRIAWGDNEPWPFDEDAAHIVRAALSQFARLLMSSYLRRHAALIAPAAAHALPVSDEFRRIYPTWGDQFTALFTAGAVALFLERTFGAQEADAFVLMENRVNGLKILPGVIAVLRRYEAEHGQGQWVHLAEFLPEFAPALRAALE